VSDWFRVEVSDHEGQIVAIETEMLAGRDIGDKERATIRRAIEHLQGFIGIGRIFCPACGPIDEPCEHVPTASDFL